MSEPVADSEDLASSEESSDAAKTESESESETESETESESESETESESESEAEAESEAESETEAEAESESEAEAESESEAEAESESESESEARAETVPPYLAPTVEVLPGAVHPTVDTSAPSASGGGHLGPGSEFQNYRMERELSRGAVGVVFLAQHLRLHTQVAIKVLLAGGHAREDERRRFLREAEAAAVLEHENVVRVLDAGEHDGAQFMAMELVPGGNLRGRLQAGSLELEEALRLFDGVCAGVEHAHARGVIHRDLKPENVMLDAEGRPKVADFGLAKRTGGPAGEHLTVDGALMGTVAYMAPEQAEGRVRDVDLRSDVYALGVILYELLCGRLPFEGPMPVLVSAKLAGEPPPPRKLRPELPWELEAIALKAMALRPDKRYRSVRELRADLQRYAEGLPVQARAAGLLYRLSKWARRHRRAVTTVLVLMAGATVFLTQWTIDRVEQSRLRAEHAEREAALLAERRAEVGAALTRAWETAAVGSLTLAAERLDELSEQVGFEALVIETAAPPELPEHLVAQLGLERPRLSGSDLREWARELRATARAERAGRLLVEAVELRQGARTRYLAGEDHHAVREGYFAALERLRAGLRLRPEDASLRDELVGVSRELAAILREAGYSELADFVLESADVREPGQVEEALPQDAHLNVVEADAVRVRQAFGGRVHFAPTRAFDSLRELLRRRAPEQRCLLSVRTRIGAEDARPRLFIEAIELKLTDRTAGTVRPTVRVACEDETAERPVRVDPRGFRRVEGLERTRELDVPRLQAAVRTALLAELEAEAAGD